MAGLEPVWNVFNYIGAVGGKMFWNLLKNGMSLQWRVITIFLYLEIALVLLMLLFSFRWNAFLESPLLTWIDKAMKLQIMTTKFKFSKVSFGLFLAFLVTRFIGASWDAVKFSIAMNDSLDMRSNPQKETELLASLYRAQRNFFISGFALFLLVVLYRLNSMSSSQAGSGGSKVRSEGHREDKASQESSAYKNLKSECELLKEKAEVTNSECDRLVQENARLQRKLEEVENTDENKKDK